MVAYRGSRPYSATLLINTLLFVASAFVPTAWRIYLWGVALLLSLSLPVFILNVGRMNLQAQAEIDVVSRVSPSLVERSVSLLSSSWGKPSPEWSEAFPNIII